jgi:hypothetical protein
MRTQACTSFWWIRLNGITFIHQILWFVSATTIRFPYIWSCKSLKDSIYTNLFFRSNHSTHRVTHHGFTCFVIRFNKGSSQCLLS